MSGNWITKAMGKTQPIEDLSSIKHEMTTLLILGRNSFGDEIYTFMELPIQQIEPVKEYIASGQRFVPSHFGKVLAAGRGVPSVEVEQEIGTPEFMIYFKPKNLPTSSSGTRGGY